MNQPTCSLKSRILLIAVLVLTFTAVSIAEETPKIDACSLLTQAEIRTALGQAVGDGALNAKANPLVGQPCEYKVGDYGVFSILVKAAGPGETADRVMTELKKSKIAVSEAADIGDQSFFSSPGYGMIQLNTFYGGKYLIITMMVPGMDETAQKSAAGNLMRSALANI